MAQYTNDFRNCQTVEDLKVRLNRYFEWFFESLDSVNVKRLYTEQCKISSKDGNTILNGTQVVMKDGNNTVRLLMGLDKNTGKFIFSLMDVNGSDTFSVSDLGQLKLGGRPLIEMYDNNNVLRLRQGFDTNTNKFVFNMYDEIGNETIGISADGKGVITGGTIIGGSLENSGNNCKTMIDSGGVHIINLLGNGTANIEKIFITSSEYDGNGTVNFTNNNSKKAEIGFDDSNLMIRSDMPIEIIAPNIIINGPVSGLSTDSAGYHNHGIPDGTALGVVDGTGAIIGSIQFTASGAHYHSIQ